MQVDLAAVSRIARRVDLRDIRLIDLSASLNPGEIQLLEPDVTFECSAEQPVPDRIAVVCAYHFIVKSGSATISDVKASYLLVYELTELEQPEIAKNELEQFAYANGTYHSWPFLRQLLFDLTAKMGLPPFTLPVFKVLPREGKIEEKGVERKIPPSKKTLKGSGAGKEPSAGKVKRKKKAATK